MADKQYEKHVLPEFCLTIDRVKIKELVAAIGDDNPLFKDDRKADCWGYAAIPAPLTFYTLAFQEFTGMYFKVLELLGIPLANLLHGEEEYEYLGAVHAGDELTGRMRILSIEEKKTAHGPMHLITLNTRFTNQDGDLVVRARSLLIERKTTA